MNIKKLRKQKGWTQSDLAERLGMTRGSVNRLENGKQELSKTVRLALKQIFNINEE